MRVLLIAPPILKRGFPYPSTTYLSGFLKSRNIDVRQSDLSIDLVHRLLSRSGLQMIREELRENRFGVSHRGRSSATVSDFLTNFDYYLDIIEPSMAYLTTYSSQIATNPEDFRRYLSAPPDDRDRQRRLYSKIIDRIFYIVQNRLDSNFRLTRFGSYMGSICNFSDIKKQLTMTPSLVVKLVHELSSNLVTEYCPELVGISLPFEINVIWGFHIAQILKATDPKIKIVMGGGYVNTSLRTISDSSVFDYIDFLSLDDGELPLISIIEYLIGERSYNKLIRTWVCFGGKPSYINASEETDLRHKDTATPSYKGLDLSRYFSLDIDSYPLSKLLNSGHWNKLTLAHGCYWNKCSFCDTSLDYISRFDSAPAETIADRIEKLIEETNVYKFHFVDEAAPPTLLHKLSEVLLSRNIRISWYCNVRFDKLFTPDICQLLAKAGCLSVWGGLEVANDRILALMNKGVSLEQLVRVTNAFSKAGILVHAYLIYGFPTQTLKEHIDALEFVRQLFVNGCLVSAVLSRFFLTNKSLIFKNPEKYGINILPIASSDFSNYIIPYKELVATFDIELITKGLNRAIESFANGIGLSENLQTWFPGLEVPAPSISADFVSSVIQHSLV